MKAQNDVIASLPGRRWIRRGAEAYPEQPLTRFQIGIAVLTVGVMAAILWDPIVDPFLHRERYRGEVRTLYENLQPGMTKEQVRREIDSGKP